jgi:Uma2 family endonuclease
LEEIGVMVNFVSESARVRIPEGIRTLQAFREWAGKDDFPEDGRIWYLKGEVWVDMSGEQLFTHLAVKNEFNMVLGRLVKDGRLGYYFPDGVLLSNVAADLACKPDAVFASNGGLQDRVRLIEGSDEGYVELEGSPDVVVEVISRSSVQKDTVLLRRAYHEAGIREYWLVDARKSPLSFDILRHTARGYVASAKRGGWVKSVVFGKAFRLTQTAGQLGHPEYTLELR